MAEVSPNLRWRVGGWVGHGEALASVASPDAGRGLAAYCHCSHHSCAHHSPSHAAAPGGGSDSSLLAQAVVAPTTSLSAGAAYLQHRTAAPAEAGPGSAAAAAAAGGGPAAVGVLEHAAAGPLALAASPGGFTPARQLGTTLAWRFGDDAVLHGWAAADADDVQTRVRAGRLASVRPAQWGLSLGSYPDGSGNAWALGVGRSAAAAAAPGAQGGAGEAASLAPNLYELSLQFNMGDGLLLTPGMVVLRRAGGGHTALLGVRSAWAF